MRWMKNQPWNTNPTYQEVNDETEWNMWTTRQAPFNFLERGDTVYLACPDGHGGSVVTWEVEVTRALTAAYKSKNEAWQGLRTTFPLLQRQYSKRQFLNADYTVQAPEAGWVLGWSYDPVRKIGVPRPAALKFRPNGWRSLDVSDSQLRAWGIRPRSERRSRKQPEDGGKRAPRRPDPLKRLAVELRAMAVARAHLVKQSGWKASEIHDTSANKPYDLECRRGNRVMRVEVKGLSGRLGAVTLTRREVEHARTAACPVMLVIVHGIGLTATADQYRGTGGTAEIWDPWTVDAGLLTPAAFDYLPPRPA